jgi:hypothetical protein
LDVKLQSILYVHAPAEAKPRLGRERRRQNAVTVPVDVVPAGGSPKTLLEKRKKI